MIVGLDARMQGDCVRILGLCKIVKSEHWLMGSKSYRYRQDRPGAFTHMLYTHSIVNGIRRRK